MNYKFEGKWKKIRFNGTVKQLLEKLDLNTEIVVVKVNDDVATEEDSIKNSDSVQILTVISGG